MVPVGGNPLLTCTVTAVPAANFSEIVRIFPGGREEVLTNATNPDDDREFSLAYSFANVKFPRDNGALFRCRATNANGPEEADVTIIVQGELYIE